MSRYWFGIWRDDAGVEKKRGGETKRDGYELRTALRISISIRIHTRYRGVAVWDGMRLVGY